MRALPIVRIRRIARPMLGCLAIFMALALLSSGRMTRPTAASGTQDQAITATFPATPASLGLIPDATAGGNICGDYSAGRDVTFTVSGLSGTITDVRVNMTIDHSWVGDLDASLRGPGGAPVANLFFNTGSTTATGCGDSSNLVGPYNLYDTAQSAITWWGAALTAADAAPIPSGDYRPSTPGGVVGGGANTVITPTFAATSPNGTWTLRIRDGGEGDTGSITSANLTITAGPTIVPQHIVDVDGDGKTDPLVIRNTGGGPGGQTTWFSLNSSGAPASTTTPWGIATDFFVPADYDGDNKSDIAVWRPGPPFGSFFYILQSSNGTLRTDTFGQSGDDPTVIGDYDGDNKEDPAVYRSGALAGDHSFWYYRSSINGLIIGTEWGQNGDFPAPGDYDGDGKNDFVVQRNAGGGQARFFLKQTTAGITAVIYGTPTDVIVPGDYDGDLKTDIATIRGSGGQILWNVLRSSDGISTSTAFGASATDLPTQGDYDGDGKTDLSVWRPDANPLQNFYYIRKSGTGTDTAVEWGQNGDYPAANYNTH